MQQNKTHDVFIGSASSWRGVFAGDIWHTGCCVKPLYFFSRKWSSTEHENQVELRRQSSEKEKRTCFTRARQQRVNLTKLGVFEERSADNTKEGTLAQQLSLAYKTWKCWWIPKQRDRKCFWKHLCYIMWVMSHHKR